MRHEHVVWRGQGTSIGFMYNSSQNNATTIPRSLPDNCEEPWELSERRRPQPVTSADDAALAYPVEFLVQRRLLIFDGATGAVDGVVNGIVEFAQILYGHLGETKTQKRIQSSPSQCRLSVPDRVDGGSAWLMPVSNISAKAAAG